MSWMWDEWLPLKTTWIESIIEKDLVDTSMIMYDNLL